MKTGRRRTAGKPRRHIPEMLLQLHLESNPEALCVVRATIECATQVLHFTEAESRAIVRSVDEALANVIRHAYGGRSGRPIEVTCRRLHTAARNGGPAGMEIVLEDSGSALEPRKMKGRPLDEVRPGGLGLHFIKASMDEVKFSRRNGKNQLRMVKYLAPATPGKASEGE